MEGEHKELVFSHKVVEMITVANEFCIFIEESEKYSKIQMLAYLEKVIPLLYLKGSLLPNVEVSDESANERFVTEEQWEKIYLELKFKFEKEDVFFINENTSEKDSLKCSFADNITDIYQDMKDFILLYQQNTMASRENAVNSCKLCFENHWGYRAIRCMYAIHHLLHGSQVPGGFPGYLNN
jgi:hypothetical protein